MHFKSPYFLRLATLSFWILMIAVALHYFFKPKDTIDFRQYRTLASFQKGKSQTPYNSATEPFTPIVDTHVHFLPFGGKEIPFNELLTYFKKNQRPLCQCLRHWATGTHKLRLHLLFGLPQHPCLTNHKKRYGQRRSLYSQQTRRYSPGYLDDLPRSKSSRQNFVNYETV